jgi:hypothetical protein
VSETDTENDLSLRSPRRSCRKRWRFCGRSHISISQLIISPQRSRCPRCDRFSESNPSSAVLFSQIDLANAFSVAAVLPASCEEDETATEGLLPINQWENESTEQVIEEF